MRILAIALWAVSGFFAYYFFRLLIVTRLLRDTPPGGGGAFVGAVVFPAIAIGGGWAAARIWRLARRDVG